MTNRQMMSICPDCVMLLPLNNTEGVKSVDEAVRKINTNTTNTHYFILKEVGRITLAVNTISLSHNLFILETKHLIIHVNPAVGFLSQHIMGTEMIHIVEFALVQTMCLMGTRIVPEACTPLCPDRAVSTSYIKKLWGKSKCRINWKAGKEACWTLGVDLQGVYEASDSTAQKLLFCIILKPSQQNEEHSFRRCLPA